MSLLLLLDPETGAPADIVRPAIADVAALLHARTYVMGDEVGTFNNDTRPTATEVNTLIDFAVADIASRVGLAIPATYAGEAKRLASLQAASLVESSYFPDQIDTDRSAYRQYQAMFLNGIQQLVARIRGGAGTGIGSLPVTTLVAGSSGLLTDCDLLA